MGVLTDFVVAHASDAQKVCESLNPSQEFSGIDAKGVGQVGMGTLYAILTHTDCDPDFMMADESFLCTGSDDGPWVQLVPEEMTARLAGITESEIPALADEWGNTEEFQPEYSSWAREDIVTFLRQISELSRKAQAEKKSLLMWTCL
jgi:hypothetical protein